MVEEDRRVNILDANDENALSFCPLYEVELALSDENLDCVSRHVEVLVIADELYDLLLIVVALDHYLEEELEGKVLEILIVVLSFSFLHEQVEHVFLDYAAVGALDLLEVAKFDQVFNI